MLPHNNTANAQIFSTMRAVLLFSVSCKKRENVV